MNEELELLAPMAVPPRWTFTPPAPMSQPLVVAGDKLIGVSLSNVFAVDIHTGQLAEAGTNVPWSLDLAGRKGRNPNVTTSKGVVYMMDDDSLLAVGLGDGKAIATWPKLKKKDPRNPNVPVIPQVPGCKRLIASNGKLVAVSTNLAGATLIRGFDPLTGELLFGPFERTEKSAGMVAYGSKTAFFVASGQLVALNTDFGDLRRWKFPEQPQNNLELDGSSEPLVAGNIVLVPGKALHAVGITLGDEKYKITATAGTAVHWYTPVTEIPKATAAATQAANLRAVRPLLGDALGTKALHAAVARVAGGIAVAVNKGGDIVGFRVADGGEVWRKRVTLPGPPMLIDGVVYLTTDEGKIMRQFDAKTGEAKLPFDLVTRAEGRPASIANGSMFSVNESGQIEAREFAVQHAAYFDGKKSHIKVKSSGSQYDFGTGDFTVEAWFRSTTGGEIISSYPTNNDPNAHGFRLQLAEGQVRVAVLNRDGTSRHVGRTSDTGADDGQWHHVAFARRLGQFVVTLDGVSQVVNLAATRADNLAIGGNSVLTIGAYIFPNIPARCFFRGQIREVRVWNHAVDVVNIAMNRDVELTGMEAALKGLWRLDEDQTRTKKAPTNIAHRNREAAEFVNPDSRVTDLTMDQSAFPYLLHEPQKQWPYAGTWGARGVYAATGSPTTSSDGVVAFSTSNAIYAVDAHDGHRIWGMDVKASTSEPVADGGSFLVLTQEDSLVRVDSKSGGKVQLEAFADLPHDSNEKCAAPAVSQKYVAAATAGPSPTVSIWDRTAPKGRTTKLAGAVVRLEFAESGLVVLTKAANGALTLHLLDLVTAAEVGKRAVATEAFCAAGTWIFATSGNAVVKLARAALGGPPLATSAALDGAITGLAASADDDLLVATTATGRACRMTLGALAQTWNKPVPAGPVAGRTAVNPPVLDPGGRVICTSTSGSVVAFDDNTGQVVGLYSMQHSPLGRPIVNAGGTVYTACQDSSANDIAENVDGAMHSLVLGETTVMRLNVDERGKGVRSAQHAVVEVLDDSATLDVLEVHESCVEAWINAPRLAGNDGIPSGGGIVSILPSATAKAAFDINLWLDPDGTLHYSSRTKDNGAWSGLHYTVATTLLDGKWHHIAASRTPPASAAANATDRVLIYIDGVLVEATRAAAPAAPAALCKGLKAYIGASAAADLSATQPFHGMIAEVRVWDTFLVATEITSRMHVKLRGDEPSLIAYWNFDHGTVHDSAVQGHDGVLAKPVTDPVWWMTDLPFTQPSYPQITSAAKITSEDEATAKSYALTLKVFAANGTGMAGQKVHLWYVKKKDTDPASVIIGGTEVQGVASADEPHPLLRAAHLAKAWAGTTLSDGTLPVTIVSSAAGHGPAIDMWTEFMPLNERFHVNVLLDNQKLSKPAPPKLTAQAKLIQDYHYTAGNKINHERDRSTWRTVIRAASAADRPRPSEPITLWASEPLTFEANSKEYSVNKDNSVTINTELDGELTLVMPAEELTAPTLYARAGFMHREDRIVINPDQDAHTQLAAIKDTDLSTERTTNWKREEDRKPEDKQSLLPADAKGEAPKVANAVRQVAQAVKPANENAKPKPHMLRMTPAREKLLRMRPMPEHERNGLLQAGRNGAWRQPMLAAMEQPKPVAKSDVVVPRRTLAGMARMAPVDPEAFRDSLHGALGFVFEKGAQKHRVNYRQLTTQQEVDAARGKATPVLLHAPVLGGFFDDLWDGVKDAANAVADAVTKVVVTITDTINLAVTTMINGIENIVHSVVKSVSDALNAIANFFEQIGAEIAKVIAFLRALFDWGNIIKTHNILKDIFNASLTISSNSLKNTAPFVSTVKKLAGVPLAPQFAGSKSMNAIINSEPEKESAIAASANSVQGKSMTQKTTTTPPTSVSAVSRAMPDPSPKADDSLQSILSALPRLADSILDLSPEDLFKQLTEIGKGLAAKTLVSSAESMAGLMGVLATTMDWTKDVLNTHIDIPFISELYKWVTGSPLTIMSVLCLALAIPVNVAYAIYTLARGNARFFFDDGKNIAKNMQDAADGKKLALDAPGAEEVPGTPGTPEFLFLVARSVACVADMHVDAIFMTNHGRGRDPSVEEQAHLGIVNVIQGVAGTIALSIQTFCTQPAFEKRVRAVVGSRSTDFVPRYIEIVYTVYGISMALRANKLRAGIMFYKDGPSAGGGALSNIKDKVEYPIAIAASIAAYGLLIYQVCNLVERYPEIKSYGNAKVADQYRALATRDILGMAGIMFEFMYTQAGAKNLRERFPGSSSPMFFAATATRYGTNIAGIVMHGIAAYTYGDVDDSK
ncbi:LamG-like jellyroll fold domain-containing protein [Ramlibacter sp. WS9]|uniref:LamG-like jellyroll fold domain-containing protein n=1 Tax=Ramlibacter sp. WS9 TaxID=1882741 RepID=UPI00130515D4|nr:LamG-like jellyroll fold domain-containing protein [Ramlibacter sp. WS9]